METRINKKTFNGLDVGKFLCAFLILFYHYFSEHGPLPRLLDETLSMYAIAVALFMVISGFLLFNKLENISEKGERWEIVKKQVCRIYSIYLLWSIPYLLYTVSSWNWSGLSAEFIFWQIQGWIFKSTFYTIWFMPMLAMGTVLAFWITEKLPQRVAITLAVGCYALGALQLTYRFIGFKIPGFEKFAYFSETWLGGARGWLFFAFPLIVVGRAMVKRVTNMRPIKMACFSCLYVILLLAEALLIRFFSGTHTGIDLTIMMIPTTFCILGFLLSIRLPDGKYVKWMRNMSTLIFMSQRLFLTVLPNIFSQVFRLIYANKYLGALAVSVFVVGLSQLIISTSKKSSMLRKLF